MEQGIKREPLEIDTVRQNADKYSMLSIVPNSAIEQREKQEQEKEDMQNTQPIINLAAHINSAWESAKSAKYEIEKKLLKNQRQRKGTYEPEDLKAIKEYGGSEIFMMLTSVKCRGGEAWMSDVILPAGEKPWSIEPTPDPDVPGDKEAIIREQVSYEVQQIIQQSGPDAITPEIVQERIRAYRDLVSDVERKKAKDIARQQELLMDDDLVEGGFYEELRKFIGDFTTFKTAFIKGPVIRNKKKRTYKDEQVVIERHPCRHWYNVSPYDIYPSPSARSLQDGYLIEHIRLRRQQLIDCIGVPGFDEDAIRNALKDYGDGGLKHWLWTDYERETIENRTWEYYDVDKTIDALEFWGDVQGKMLVEWGMDEMDVPDQDVDYQITGWLVGRYVVMARINPNKMGTRPYYGASYELVPNSIWGIALPETMEDCQRICNAAARALTNNMAIGSGPLVEVSSDRLAPGEDVKTIYPWMITKTHNDDTSAGKPAINFYQPNMVVQELLAIYEYFFKQASEQSGIPAYVYGSEKVGGAGDTASGLSMLMNASSKILKGVISHIDSMVIKPAITDLWFHKMENDADFPKNGDINIIARASDTLLIAEHLQILRNQALATTANPIDMQIIGLDGRAKLLRESFKGLKLGENIVPSQEELEMKQQEQAMQAQQQQQIAAQQQVVK